MWTHETTRGYTEEELFALDAEWEAILETEGLTDADVDAKDTRAKQFADDVSRRTPPIAKERYQ